MEKIGSILHGALGDYYEQLLCLKIYKERNPNKKVLAFFSSEKRMKAFEYFNLEFIDGKFFVDEIDNIQVDKFYQFQVKDKELNSDVICKLKPHLKDKIDFSKNNLPWDILKKNNFKKNPLKLSLSVKGNSYLEKAISINGIDQKKMATCFKVGFLWRYRQKGSINSFGQFPAEVIRKNINEILEFISKELDVYILACGMGKGILEKDPVFSEVVKEGGIGLGERRNTFTDLTFDLNEEDICYLKGVGYAVEMEIMSWCDLLIVMPSGFSEPLWMRQEQPVVMVFPPLEYLLRLWRRQAPFFDHSTFNGRVFNSFRSFSSKSVIRRLQKSGYLSLPVRPLPFGEVEL